jgi:hypothetical protein
MKTYWGSGGIAPRTSALDGGEWSVSRSGLFTPRKRAPGTHWIGRWVSPKAVLYTVVKRKILRYGDRETENFNQEISRKCRSQWLSGLLYPGFGDTVFWVRCAGLEDGETMNFRLNVTFIVEKTNNLTNSNKGDAESILSVRLS